MINTYETFLEPWTERKPRYALLMDADGDVLIVSGKDYSIALSPTGAKQLRDWLVERFPLDLQRAGNDSLPRKPKEKP